MSLPPLKIAVVGHTNTGKTSLMRTLMRDVGFGEVSPRPAVTRDVEAAVLRAGGAVAIELFDTPGLEDSIGLLEHLQSLQADRRIDGIEVLEEFLSGEQARHRFAQEAKAIRQLLHSDAALYVIDARDRVLGKHRDELQILGMCARPIVPVLNFTAAEDAQIAQWREHLSRVSMHAVAEFDTVVFDARHEHRLFEKMRSLLDSHRATLDALIADRRAQRAALVRSSAIVAVELLIDAAAYALSVPARDRVRLDAALGDLKQAVRAREQSCVDQLLSLHRFREDDVDDCDLPIEDGEWGVDLFSTEAMKQFGFTAGGAAAAGAMVGLTLDVMLAGLSLGAGMATGAAIGALFGAVHTHGRRVLDRARGLTELRCDDATLGLLAARQITLILALLRRGHASMTVVHLAQTGGDADQLPRRVMQLLRRARLHRGWSSLATHAPAEGASDPARQEVADDLATCIETILIQAAGEG